MGGPDMNGFGVDPRVYVTGAEQDRAAACVACYLAECTGAWFNRLADPDPHRLTAQDLVAVTTLSVEVPAAVAIWIDQNAADITALLENIPTCSISDAAPTDLDEQSSAQRLWDLLRHRRWPDGKVDANGVGPVTAGKLLSAKRPALIPIWDQWVEKGVSCCFRGSFRAGALSRDADGRLELRA